MHVSQALLDPYYHHNHTYDYNDENPQALLDPYAAPGSRASGSISSSQSGTAVR